MIREKIKARLKELGISQKKCATEIGIEYTNFNTFLLGKRPLPLPDLEKVFEYLKLDIIGRPISRVKKK